MFRRWPKVFHNNYNCINHTGVIYSQYLFGDTFGKKPTNLQCKSTDWLLYDMSPHQRYLRTGLREF